MNKGIIVTMIPQGLSVQVAGELIKNSVLKSFSGIQNITSLGGNPKQHISTEVINAVGSCEIWLP